MALSLNQCGPANDSSTPAESAPIVLDSPLKPPPDVVPPAAAPCLERMFELWMAPLIRERCSTCHVEGGRAAESRLLFASDAEGFRDDLEAIDRKMFFEALADPELREWLYDKPTASIDHEGGVQVAPGSPRAHAIESIIALASGEQLCDVSAHPAALTDEDFVLISEATLLGKAHRLFSAISPTAAALADVAADPKVLRPLLMELMKGEVFIEEIASIYEDMLLTQTYRSGGNSYTLMRSWGLFETSQGEKRGDHRWFDAHAPPLSDQNKALLYGSAYGFSRSAKELIKHVLREDLDFGEILTAPYTMVNAYSAHNYGVEAQIPQGIAPPTTGEEPREPFFPVTLPVPTAGLLSDINFLAVYPTNAANLNRNRSREVNDHFLARDILDLSTRTSVSFETSVPNPTYEDPTCIVCHIRLDPIAGAFQNWPRVTGAQGIYDPLHPDGQARWATEEEALKLLPPGMELDVVLPDRDKDQALPWLAKQIVADPRFAIATVHTIYRGVTGREPLSIPDPDREDYVEAARAWRYQRAQFDAIARVFYDKGRDLRELVVALLMSPLVRTRDGADGSVPVLSSLGLAKMPGAVSLERKLIAATGRTWSNYYAKTAEGDANYHWNNDIDRPQRSHLVRYREACGNGGNGCYAKWWSLLGGIDINPNGGHAVALSSPNVINTAIWGRMAHEMAWRIVARDFSITSQNQGAFDRRLFPWVDLDTVPEDENGNPLPSAIEAIKKNIVYLHGQVLAESLAPDHPEVNASYGLFYSVWQGRPSSPKQLGMSERVAQAEIDYHAQWRASQGLPALERREVLIDEYYTVRAWRAVVDYLLSDYRFLYDHIKPVEDTL